MKTEGIVLTDATALRQRRRISRAEFLDAESDSEKDAATFPGGASIPVFMTKVVHLRRPISSRPVDAEEERKPASMCITASTPPWARVRHWSAPERVKDSAETFGLSLAEPVTAPWECPLSNPEDVKVMSGLMEGSAQQRDTSCLTLPETALAPEPRPLHPLLRRYAADKPLTYAKLLAKRKMAQLAQTGLDDPPASEVTPASGDLDLEQKLYYVPELPDCATAQFSARGEERLERPVGRSDLDSRNHSLHGGSPSTFDLLPTDSRSSKDDQPSSSSSNDSPGVDGVRRENKSPEEVQIRTPKTQTEKTQQSEIESSYRSRSNQPHKKQLQVTSTTPCAQEDSDITRPLSAKREDEVGVKKKRKKRPQRRPASKADSFGGLFGSGLGVARILKWICVSLFLVACLGPLSAYGNSKRTKKFDNKNSS